MIADTDGSREDRLSQRYARGSGGRVDLGQREVVVGLGVKLIQVSQPGPHGELTGTDRVGGHPRDHLFLRTNRQPLGKWFRTARQVLGPRPIEKIAVTAEVLVVRSPAALTEQRCAR
jgi:hypothetical protein